MITFRRKVDPGAGVHPTVDALLEERLGELQRTRLVHWVEEANQALAEAPGGELDVPAGFPWITPILGSGCVAVGLVEDDGAVELHARLRSVEAALAGEPALADGSTAAKLASRFAVALLRDRLRRWPEDDEPQSSDPAPVDERNQAVAELLLVTALLTGHHHEALAAALAPVPRWDQGDAVELALDPARASELELLYVDRARMLMDRLLEKPAGRKSRAKGVFGQGVASMLDRRRDLLSARRVTPYGELRLLTECTWFFLVQDALTAPGWSDVLLNLARDFPEIRHQDGRPRPLYTDVSDPPLEVVQQYRKVAAASWTQRKRSVEDAAREGRADAPTIHDRVAGVLAEQARLQGSHSGPEAVPMAAAFVTGFDLELELAMARADQNFVLAVPAIVVPNQPSADVSILWLGCVVEPDRNAPEGAAVDAILPTSRWFVLSGCSTFGKTDTSFRGWPVIVRLTGCPAIDLPDLGADDELHSEVARLAGDDPGGASGAFRLKPAFVLDDYVAGALGATETFLDHLDHARLGLPRWIAGVPGGRNARYARFWLGCGVQLADSSVRQRVVAQVTSPAITTALPIERPKVRGLMVSRNLGPIDGRLMQWEGFDLVADDVEELDGELAHYAAHLERPDARCGPNCDLGEEP